MNQYRGRLAPTPSGHLHLGHARTFWIAQNRARKRGGALVLRIEDLDRERCKPRFVADMIDDLRWIGLAWDEGPDVGGPFAPYNQSERTHWYTAVWRLLHAARAIYPSSHSRKDVQQALLAPHEDDDQPLFPASLRPAIGAGKEATSPGGTNWRFRVPDGRTVAFVDARLGLVQRTAGSDFGDFIVWRKDGLPSYELAVVADDRAMQITELVRGEDLLASTARQLLLYETLGWPAPAFFHCPLLRDDAGARLAKRHAALSLRRLREQGWQPRELRETAPFSQSQ